MNRPVVPPVVVSAAAPVVTPTSAAAAEVSELKRYDWFSPPTAALRGEPCHCRGFLNQVGIFVYKVP